ncbi:unnamed protein product [Staurois parvus]|uniref:Uncharacterized protein n=1 Tax=Staurois parvus TaxID=386267 RepID=A0ABN9HJJ2_9NEOB|nr:unnamed protein product [Staurois parvus]
MTLAQIWLHAVDCPSGSRGAGLWPVGVNHAPSLVLMRGIVTKCWYNVGGIVSHLWCQWEE